MLKRKAYYGFLSLKEAKWRKERHQLIERALESKRRLFSLRVSFDKLLDNIVMEKRKRIILATVLDFRKHSLTEKVFRVWKLYRAQRRRKGLMIQVADDFRNNRIATMIAEGKRSMKINRLTGVLTNQN